MYRQDSDDSGRFTVTGLPGRGVLLVTARADGGVFYPMLSGVAADDRRRGIGLADDELVLNTLPQPLSLVGSHAYQVIDIRQDQSDFEANFDLSLHRGRTVNVRVVDPKDEPLQGVMAFGLRHATVKAGQTAHGDRSFAVHDLDVAGHGEFSSTNPIETSLLSSTWLATSQPMSPHGCHDAARLSGGLCNEGDAPG